MSFPVIIIFLVLLLWLVICLPLLELYYLESKLDKVHDMTILFMAITFIVVGVVIVSYGVK